MQIFAPCLGTVIKKDGKVRLAQGSDSAGGSCCASCKPSHTGPGGMGGASRAVKGHLEVRGSNCFTDQNGSVSIFSELVWQYQCKLAEHQQHSWVFWVLFPAPTLLQESLQRRLDLSFLSMSYRTISPPLHFHFSSSASFLPANDPHTHTPRHPVPVSTPQHHNLNVFQVLLSVPRSVLQHLPYTPTQAFPLHQLAWQPTEETDLINQDDDLCF